MRLQRQRTPFVPPPTTGTRARVAMVEYPAVDTPKSARAGDVSPVTGPHGSGPCGGGPSRDNGVTTNAG